MGELTIQTLIDSGADVAVGMVSGAGEFIGGLYSANPIGQFIVVSGIAGCIIGVAKSLFLRKKHI